MLKRGCHRCGENVSSSNVHETLCDRCLHELGWEKEYGEKPVPEINEVTGRMTIDSAIKVMRYCIKETANGFNVYFTGDIAEAALVLADECERSEKWFNINAGILASHNIGGFSFL